MGDHPTVVGHARVASQGFVVVGRDIDPDEWQQAVDEGLRPRHYALQLAEVLGLELASTAGLVPNRLDRALSIAIGRPQVWALARSVARRSDPDEFVYATDESFAIAILLAGRHRRRRARSMAMYMMAPHRTRTRFWFRILWLLRILPRTTVVGLPEVEREVRTRLPIPESGITLVDTAVDEQFFCPPVDRPARERPLLVSAGLEHRDYGRVADAVRGLDVDLVVCALSPDAKQAGSTDPIDIPDNMVFSPLTMSDLRDLYQRADVCVLSTTPNHFGAGLTSVLEALACGAGVVISVAESDLAGLVEAGLADKAADASPEALREAIETAIRDIRSSERPARHRLTADGYVARFAELFERTHDLSVVDRSAVTESADGLTVERRHDARIDPSGVAGLLSVVIPVAAIEPGLTAQLEALFAQKTASPFDIVISHNMANPHSRRLLTELLEPFVARSDVAHLSVVEANEKAGAAYARNTGARAATGEFLAFCDADDVVHPGWIDAIVAGLEDHAAVTGAIVEIAPRGQEDWRPPATPGSLPEFHGAKYVLSGNLGIRRSAFADIAGFDETLTRCEDIAMGWSLQNRGHRIGFAPDAVLDYHHRAGLREMLRQHYLYGKGMAEVLERYPNPVMGVHVDPAKGLKGKLALLKPNAQPHRRTVISETRRVAIGLGRVAVLVGRR